ncbi:alkaline phosphatase family protein [Komagataeibacter rhaeticus]|nr:alkaline phosphatase family protein [Komagataeibacter rhaeticus]
MGMGTQGHGRMCLTTATITPRPISSTHHQPYNYYLNYAPGTQARQAHLLDGGLAGAGFIDAIDHGSLPQVAFYKPQGNLNEHSGYADIQSGDRHIADLIEHLEKSPSGRTCW